MESQTDKRSDKKYNDNHLMNDELQVFVIYSIAFEDHLEGLINHPVTQKYHVKWIFVNSNEFNKLSISDQNRVVIWVCNEELDDVLLIGYRKQCNFGFLPAPNESRSPLLKCLELPTGFDECLEIALTGEPTHLDVIVCNGQLVTSGIRMLNQLTMSEFLNSAGEMKLFSKLKFRLRRFFHAFLLRPHSVEIATAKGKTLSTAITGMIVLDIEKTNPMVKLFGESVSMRDQRVSLALLAPQSILGYLRMTSSALFSNQNTMPPELGYIRSASVKIMTHLDTHYFVNQKPLTTRELKIEHLSEGLQVFAGKKFKESHHYQDDKENVVWDGLPQQEDKVKYLSQALPFFPHASKADFKELFVILKASARTGNSYITLMVLSSMLATMGLFLNSPSVVIGAMVLAPLMSPITSLSMGLLRSDEGLSRQSLLTLSTGVVIALTLSSLMAATLPFQEMTNEIEARLHPSTLDLLVAILSGIAGALANVRENIAKSLPGVAIAVALVPPVCVAGIGLGWSDNSVFWGASLLFLTNLVGIILAAGLTFLVVGFSPFTRARKGILISLFLVAIVTTPLYFAFKNLQRVAEIKSYLVSQRFAITQQIFRMRNVKVSSGNVMSISADLLCPKMPNEKVFEELEQVLTETFSQPVQLNLSVHVTNNMNL